MDSIESVNRNPLFEEAVRAIRRLGTDNLAHFGNGYRHEGGLSLQQNPEEFAALILLLCEHALRYRLQMNGDVRGPGYLEIGSASGGALRLLHQLVGFEMLWTIDNHGHFRWVEQAANWHGLGVEEFVGDSHSPEAAAWLVEKFSGPIRRRTFAFIDGDHSYEGCVADARLVRPHLSPGSLVIFHDTVACDGVKRAWEETAEWAKPIANFIGSGYRPLGIGVLEVP